MNKRLVENKVLSVSTTVLLTVLVSTVPLLSGCSELPFLNGKTKKSVSVEGVVQPSGKGMSVWFVKPNGENLELVAVKRSPFGDDQLESAVEQLLRGPDPDESEKGIATEIPRGTILLGVEREDGEVVINLSRRFASAGGPTSMETRLDQLSKTIEAVAGDEKVFLNVEGSRLTAASFDGLEIKQPIN